MIRVLLADDQALIRAGFRALLEHSEDLLVVGEATDGEQAVSLFLSPFTAKTHVSRIMTKLAARDRAQLVVIAYETGLVTVGIGRSQGE